MEDDFDWDYAYILRLLRYKLSRTRQCIVANSRAVSAKKIGKQIRKVEALLGQVVDDRYYQKISISFHKKYGQPRILKLPSKKDARAIPITIRYQKETPQNSHKLHREAMRLFRKAERMKTMDLKKAFGLMHKEIWGWWD